MIRSKEERIHYLETATSEMKDQLHQCEEREKEMRSEHEEFSFQVQKSREIEQELKTCLSEKETSLRDM